jgi:ketosteroid isomerase-like protein
MSAMSSFSMLISCLFKEHEMTNYCAPSRFFASLLAMVLIALTLQTGLASAAEETREKQAVIAANAAFYRAFRDKDLEAMDAVWAKKAKVSVIHPGWNAIFGRDKVMGSWQSIIDSGGAPKIESVQPVVLFRDNSAVVLCYEKVGDSYLVATNIFVLEDSAWRIIHHHAGPAPAANELFKGDPV